MSTENQSRRELQKQLLELVYGLLDDEEAAALRERIASEPEVAAAHAEAERFAGALAASARLVAPQMELKTQKRSPWRHRVEIRANKNGTPVAGSHSTRAPRILPLPVEQRITRAIRRTVAIAATILAIVTVGGYLVASWPLIGLDAKHIRLTVTGPRQLEPGLENLFTINATSATGRPMVAPIIYALRSADGAAIVDKTTATTDRSGQLTIKLKPTLVNAERVRDARLIVQLADAAGAEPLTASLRIDSTCLATQLSLGKPLYQPGEIIRYRSLTLSRFGLTPPAGALVYFEIHDPSGAVVPNSWKSAIADRGVAGGEFAVPSGLAGGEYTLIARSPAKQFADEKRTFFVRSYRLPRLKKDLEFTRDSYSPGDHVVADLSVQRPDGGPAAGAKLHAIASVDGKTVAQSEDVVGPAGTARVEINLPAKVEKGDAQLAVVIDDGGNRETVAKTIRINLDRVEISLYPEGGDLVAGLENRVYFSAQTPLGKPAHIVGQLVDSQFREVAKLETSYKGMGSFKFAPQAGETYSVVAGKLHVSLTPDQLKVEPAPSVLLSTGAGVFGATEPLAVELQSREDKLPLLVAAYCRGVMIGQKSITASRGTNRVEIPLAAGAGGVVRVTVFDQLAEHGRQPRAIAERLVYRRAERALTVRIGDHKPRYSPGDPVELSFAVTNERGEPTPAALGVSVAADSLFKLIDDEIPSMPTRFYILGEIEKPQDLEKADFYLSENPKAPAALDLLLGTQGWRRFAEKRMSDYVFKDDGSDPFNRLAAVGAPGGPPMTLDNGDESSRAYQADLNRHTVARDAKLNALGRALLFTAAPVGLFFLFILAWGSIGRLQFWLPTLGTAAASLIAATIWSNLPLNISSEADSNSVARSSSRTAEATMRSDDGKVSASRLDDYWRDRGITSDFSQLPRNEISNPIPWQPWSDSAAIYYRASDFAPHLDPPELSVPLIAGNGLLAGSNTSTIAAFNFPSLSGNNSYAGGTTVMAGTLSVGGVPSNNTMTPNVGGVTLRGSSGNDITFNFNNSSTGAPAQNAGNADGFNGPDGF
ncbi:MAG TPA: autotransporter-associated beta strand repeat-containing protein, partial [Pirellulales bacterium]|nr:autotransporter-associated beta strand repeat-containing protein [Pirellulales bacterium]